MQEISPAEQAKAQHELHKREGVMQCSGLVGFLIIAFSAYFKSPVPVALPPALASLQYIPQWLWWVLAIIPILAGWLYLLAFPCPACSHRYRYLSLFGHEGCLHCGFALKSEKSERGTPNNRTDQ